MLWPLLLRRSSRILIFLMDNWSAMVGHGVSKPGKPVSWQNTTTTSFQKFYKILLVMVFKLCLEKCELGVQRRVNSRPVFVQCTEMHSKGDGFIGGVGCKGDEILKLYKLQTYITVRGNAPTCIIILSPFDGEF